MLRVKDGFRNKRWVRACSQVLIISFCSTGCFNRPDTVDEVSIRWKDGEATGIFIPKSLLSDVPEDSIEALLKIRLVSEGLQPAIFGEYFLSEDPIVFDPLISLTRGLKYDVRLRDRSLAQIFIPLDPTENQPEVVSIFPSQDSLPENLLKIYLTFSKPMREGKSHQNIVLIKNNVDTINNAFLFLQQELWNRDRTILTVWLDPGRIKRELQPNKQMGLPLEPGARYQLSIGKDWQDAKGDVLKHSFVKYFFVISSDKVMPNPHQWSLRIPDAETKNQIEIAFHESLDFMLLNTAITICDDQGKVIEGEITILNEEKKFIFSPVRNWLAGSHTIKVESQLEDLAGNNLNRLFDTDLTLNTPVNSLEVFEIEFQIR